jgi:hypothetical protein
MKIKAFKDFEYLKGMLYLEEHQDSSLLQTDRYFRREYNLVSYVMELHDDGKFPYYPKDVVECGSVSTGMQIVRELPDLF